MKNLVGIALRLVSMTELDIYLFPVQPEIELKWLLSLIPPQFRPKRSFLTISGWVSVPEVDQLMCAQPGIII